jgi:hypothetical protein
MHMNNTRYRTVPKPIHLAATFALASISPHALAEAADQPFSVAHIFFELNDTDGDLGIHALIDGEPWQQLEIVDPRERRLLLVTASGRLRKQGLTELFFESAEPTFDELAPEDLFRRFPVGIYDIEGLTLDGRELESEAELTHVLPAAPQPLVNGVDNRETDAEGELGCFRPRGHEIEISWPHVATSHEEIGEPGVVIERVNYEVVVEIDGTPYRTSAVLQPDANMFVVPGEILDAAEVLGADEVKFEVLVREASFNQTATETCFELE